MQFFEKQISLNVRRPSIAFVAADIADLISPSAA